MMVLFEHIVILLSLCFQCMRISVDIKGFCVVNEEPR